LQQTRLAFHTASSEEIMHARVADVYFHRTIEVLRARGVSSTPVQAELTLKSGDRHKWFVVAGTEEVAHLLEGPV
jgi:nicotinate phosphoribosyltransferase